jgi:hypothetical protein
MPTVSKKQERFMQAVANNPKFAKKAGVSQSVGREFTKKDGGVMQKHSDMKKDKPMMEKVAKKAVKGHEVKMHGAKKMMGGGMAKGYKSGGGIDGCASKGKTKGAMVAMKTGGIMKKGSRGC